MMCWRACHSATRPTSTPPSARPLPPSRPGAPPRRQERARYFFTLRQLLEDHREELARLIVTEMGKTLDDARGEVQRGIDNVETACGIPP